MKQNQIAKQIEWLGTTYRITKYFGSEILRLEELENSGWFNRPRWKTLYFGHIDVLQDCDRFFQANASPQKAIKDGGDYQSNGKD